MVGINVLDATHIWNNSLDFPQVFHIFVEPLTNADKRGFLFFRVCPRASAAKTRADLLTSELGIISP